MGIQSLPLHPLSSPSYSLPTPFLQDSSHLPNRHLLVLGQISRKKTRLPTRQPLDTQLPPCSSTSQRRTIAACKPSSSTPTSRLLRSTMIPRRGLQTRLSASPKAFSRV